MSHRPKLFRVTSLLVLCGLVLLFVPAAQAADATTTAAPITSFDSTALAEVPVVTQEGITNFQGMQVNVVNNQGRKFMIVGGFLPEAAQLPAKVQLAVPKGAQIAWLGEVANGTDGGQDIQLSVPAPATQGEQDIYTVTLTTHRSIVAEFPTDDPFKESETTTGTPIMTAVLSYTPLTDLMYLYLGAEIPSDVAVLSTDFQNAGTTQTGTVIYSTQLASLKAGQKAEATLTYTKASASKDTTHPLVIAAIVVLVVAVGALVFLLLRKRLSAAQELE
jgi:hypothetical protein